MQPSALETPRRARLVLLSCLLAATLCAGVAARVIGGRGQPGPGTAAATTASSRAGAVSLRAALDRASVLRGGDGLVRVELTLEGGARPALSGAALPTDLVVVLDRSGSMDGEPIAFARSAVRELYAGLRAEDRFALVGYASDAAVELPLAPAGGAMQAQVERTLESILASGGTHMSAGLDLAHEVVQGAHAPGRVQRLVLLSDGHANQGDFSHEGLRSRAARAVQAEYVLSAVGIGQGFDETLMSALADAGTGNFYYLPDVRELAGIFAGEFAAARETVARGLRVALTPAPGVELLDAGGYPLEREGSRVAFRPGDLFAGQQRRVWLTLRAPTAREGEVPLGALALAWNEADGARLELPALALPELACVAGEDAYYASFDEAVYPRSASENLGSLRERVAPMLRSGRQGDAIAEVDLFTKKLEDEQVRAFGRVAPEDKVKFSALRSIVAAPSAAEPSVQQQLGKQLLEEGRDARREGAKH